MEKPLRVGIIGLGNIAKLHVGGWSESPHAEIVAGCDVDVEKFGFWEKEYGL